MSAPLIEFLSLRHVVNKVGDLILTSIPRYALVEQELFCQGLIHAYARELKSGRAKIIDP